MVTLLSRSPPSGLDDKELDVYRPIWAQGRTLHVMIGEASRLNLHCVALRHAVIGSYDSGGSVGS